MATTMVQVKVRVRPSQEEWLRTEADARGISMSALLRAAVDHYAEVLPPARRAAPTGTELLDAATAAIDA